MDQSMIIFIVPVLWLLLGIIGSWLLFRKAGRPGILSLIPGVNLIVEYSICWSWFFGLIFFLLLGGANYCAGAEQTMPAGIAGIIAMILHWIESQKLARSFGKGFLYGLFLFLFDRFARVVLGLSNARYTGKH